MGRIANGVSAALHARIATLGAVWLPPRCAICGGCGGDGIDLCAACDGLLPAPERPIDGRCPCLACGDPVPIDTWRAARRCARCLARPGPFRRIDVAWRYAPPVDRLVSALKHDGLRPLARVFGTAIARSIVATGGDLSGEACVVPVPLHPSRLRQRGFNQAAEIARWAARPFALEVRPGAARRVVDTGSLAERSRVERQLAIRGAFRVEAAVAGRHVILVDDVFTSGATAGELARECQDSGAASVSLWAVARTASTGTD